jgi:carbamoyl-phosphate synthase large subunit
VITAMVTGAGALLGQGIIRSLQQSSLEIRTVSLDPSGHSAGLYWTDEAYRVPFAHDPAYGERVEELIAKVRPDIVFVGIDVELPFFAENREKLERHYSTVILVSDPRVVQIADDKYLTYLFLKESGFPAPDSVLPEDKLELKMLVERVGFPLIVKPRVGARSIGMAIVENRTDLDRTLEGRAGLIVQECVGSERDEYTASVLVFDNEPRASIVMRRDLRDGNTYRAFTEQFTDLNMRVREWGAALAPFGPANFQFRVDANGVAKVFEINARFSGTTPLRALVGFNEVEMCADHLLNGSAIEQPQIQCAAILRYWAEMKIDYEQVEAIR